MPFFYQPIDMLVMWCRYIDITHFDNKYPVIST